MTTAKSQTTKPITDYVWPKPNARHLWFRMAVPTRYQSLIGSRIIQKSLGTSDRRAASILAGRWRAELHDQWAALIDDKSGASADSAFSSRPIEPTLIDLKIAAAESGYTAILGKLADLKRSKPISDNASYKAYYESLREQLLRLVRTKEAEATSLWRRVADRQIAARGWLLPVDGAGYSQFVDMIGEAAIEALRIEIERGSGNSGAEPTAPVVVNGQQAKVALAPEGESIMELFERYATMRLAEKVKRQDTINQDRKVVEQFASFVGAKLSVRAIDTAMVRNWRDTMAALPANYAKMNDYRGLSMREAAAKAWELKPKGVSPSTINKYLSTISPLFKWCRRQGYASHNPCDGLFYDNVKGRNPRPPFEVDQLNKILQSPLFTGFLCDGQEHVPGDVRVRDWRYWVPLICMFTGARIGEIAQLRLEDVRQEHGVWFIHIRHDEKTGQTTKSSHSRSAPVHSKLEALGFLHFVEEQRKRAGDDTARQLFPQLSSNGRGHIGDRPSRFWRRYLTKIKVKNGGDGFGSHSFRHLLADQLRLADHLDDEIEVALGHNQKSVTGGYGKIKQGTVSRLKKMFESVKFEGVSFDHLMDR